MITIHERVVSWQDDRAERGTLVIPNASDALHWLVSEVGEFTDVFMRQEAPWYIRNNPTWHSDEELRAQLAKELCDIVCMTCATARALEIDLDKELERFLEEERA